MSRRTLDAAAMAARMNARPLEPDTDGGEWYGTTCGDAGWPHTCDGCGRTLPLREGRVLSYSHALCLPCALDDCKLAEGGAL